MNGKWVKSQKVVHFPFDDFDPTPYLASVPQETILRHKELLELKTDLSSNDIVNELDEVDASDPPTTVDTTTEEPSPSPSPSKDSPAVANKVLRQSKTASAKRQRLISTSLTTTPIVDGEFEDYHQHKLKADVDKFDPKYKLYAVVVSTRDVQVDYLYLYSFFLQSHSGMLNGGHYISYASNTTGSWYCYNDSSCREISQKPNIDPSAAYLLFYERQGLDYEPYLPNIDGRTISSAAALQVDVDETEGELKKLCSIS